MGRLRSGHGIRVRLAVDVLRALAGSSRRASATCASPLVVPDGRQDCGGRTAIHPCSERVVRASWRNGGGAGPVVVDFWGAAASPSGFKRNCGKLSTSGAKKRKKTHRSGLRGPVRPISLMAYPEGLEPPTFWSVAKCSIQLSYGYARASESVPDARGALQASCRALVQPPGVNSLWAGPQ